MDYTHFMQWLPMASGFLSLILFFGLIAGLRRSKRLVQRLQNESLLRVKCEERLVAGHQQHTELQEGLTAKQQELAILEQRLLHETSRSSGLALQLTEVIAGKESVQQELSVARERNSHLEAVEVALHRQLSELKESSLNKEGDIARQQKELSELQRIHSVLQESLLKERKHAEEKLELLESNRQQLKLEFENLANQIFESKQQSFQEQSKKGLDTLLSPFRDQLETFRKRVDHVYSSETQDRASLRSQVTELHKLNRQITEEAANLTKALRGEKKTQGNWGELMLETVLERSGLRKGIEYHREETHRDDQGKLYRPDVVIHLPEHKHVVVDAKVSLNDYTDYVNADNEPEREIALKRHVECVRSHIRGLSEKAYQKLPDINSPDFVFMFMPVEPAFMVAFEQDERLFIEAFEKRIVVVTPTTMLASLRTVSSLWSLEKQNRSARQLADQAGKVYDKLRVVVENMEKLGKQIGTAQDTWHSTWNSLREGRGNLVSQSQRFIDLGVRVKKELPKALVESADQGQDSVDEFVPEVSKIEKLEPQ